MVFVALRNKENCAWNLWELGNKVVLVVAPMAIIDSSKLVWRTPICESGIFCAMSIGAKWILVTWLILPVVICLSQRLSHACLSINNFVLWNCEWLIKSVIVYLMLPCYMDNCGNSRANTCIKQPRLLGGVYLLDKKPTRLAAPLVIHNNLSNRMALCRRCIIQISALSTFDGRIEAYHGFNG